MITIYKNFKAQKKIFDIYDTNFARSKTEYKPYYIPTEFTNTHIVKIGDGSRPPLMYLHAMNTNASIIWPHAQMLSKYYTVYTIDIPGKPGKSNLYKKLKNFDDLQTWIKEVMEQLEITKADFMGSSLGAHYALRIALSSAELVDDLILVSPPGLAGMPLQAIKLMMYSAFNAKNKKGTRLLLNKLSYPGSIIDEDFIEHMYQANKYTRQYFPFPTTFKPEELKQIKNRTLLVYGEREDGLINQLKSMENAQRYLTNSKVTLIKKSGHLVGLEQPNAINDEIENFILTKKI